MTENSNVIEVFHANETPVRDNLLLLEPVGFSSTLLSDGRFLLNQKRDEMVFQLVGVSEQRWKPPHRGLMIHHCPQGGGYKHLVRLHK